jgi:FtsH-binding integral membrane protein
MTINDSFAYDAPIVHNSFVRSVYGWATKKDLTSFGSFLFMGLIGIIIASVVNLFLKRSGMSMIISYIGVFLFIGLTVYDTQRLKNMALTQPAASKPALCARAPSLAPPPSISISSTCS